MKNRIDLDRWLYVKRTRTAWTGGGEANRVTSVWWGLLRHTAGKSSLRRWSQYPWIVMAPCRKYRYRSSGLGQNFGHYRTGRETCSPSNVRLSFTALTHFHRQHRDQWSCVYHRLRARHGLVNCYLGVHMTRTGQKSKSKGRMMMPKASALGATPGLSKMIKTW